MARSVLGMALLLSAGLSQGAGCGAAEPQANGQSNVPVENGQLGSKAPEYLVLGPKTFADELAPLLEHRKQQGMQVAWRDVESIYARRSSGQPSADALRAEIEEVAALPSSKLRFVLLAGDPTFDVPTFMKASQVWAARNEEYPADHDFIAGAKRPIAIGRFPARSDREMALFVEKTVRYETAEKAGAWQRRTLIFGGPAEFGPMVDGIIESQATSLLDQLLPYDYDVGVLFAKKDSPYAYRFDQLGRELVREINDGALIAVYAGHGLETSFDRTHFRGRGYSIGELGDLETIDVAAGSPLFISLTCLTGDFGAPGGQRSVGETMLLRPHGPVAIFASSGVSHPYPNLLYARALIESLLKDRAATVGDAVVQAKREMPEASIPFASLLVPGDHVAIKASHLQLYNLLGDPALRLRLPAELVVSLSEKTVLAGGVFEVNVQGAVPDAAFEATLETERVSLKPGITPPATLDEMQLEEAFVAMSNNHRIANDKVLARQSGHFVDGRGKLSLTAPKAAGRYVVKVFSVADRGAAAGHVRLEVQ